MLADVLVSRVAATVRDGLEGPLPPAHRALQVLAESCAYAWLAPGPYHHDARLLGRAAEAVAALAAQQTASGLFAYGDNVESPPDSSFTVNGLARLVRVGRAHDGLAELVGQVEAVLERIMPALVAGGIHTPNHRWEISSALVQLWSLTGDDAPRRRAEQWLAEGIDVQADGHYSERSPNYAAYVSNPCLLTLGELLGREDYVGIVHDNLHAILTLTDVDGIVETVASRRQDQGSRFTLAPFADQYRRFARDCGACAYGEQLAESLGGGEPVAALAQWLLEGGTDVGDGRAPAAWQPAAGWTVVAPTGVALWRSGATRIVVREAPDVAAAGRVASGLAANPTFARARVGGVRVESLRLSRSFFNLGPFRATAMTVGQDAVLTETLSAGYYQPLPEPGPYALEFEGRFAAQMAFSQRGVDRVELATTVTVTPAADGPTVSVETVGPSVPTSLEIGLGDVAVVGEGVREAGDGLYELVAGQAALTSPSWAGTLTVRVEPAPVGPAVPYQPGESYTALHGTDAVGGTRLLVPLASALTTVALTVA